MSQLTLFTDSRFPCPQRLQLVIFELGLKITNIHQLDIIKREQQKPEFLEINPFGAVPCLQDHSHDPVLVLTESRAIARYLADRYGGPDNKLIPEGGVAKAKFEEAASIELTSFDAVANPLAFEAYFKPQFMKQEPKDQVVKDLKVKLERVLRLLDQKLSTQPFMAGEMKGRESYQQVYADGNKGIHDA
ncbi:thioredoxin-like protein [Fusarium oxysporum Fo47]|uniref:thioredoxin-like protein n=1 Tax=Fusarium oxysporum Fo47 TaxID=660027 RepID=UPI0028699834|nr:thioredoxin-like protein [Fusarium oxysporum Fo47]WJG35108.1 thioredoxin-like protein [Fusarium oxysporum Fo47]